MKTLFRGSSGGFLLARAGGSFGPDIPRRGNPRRRPLPAPRPPSGGPGWLRKIIAANSLSLANAIRRMTVRACGTRFVTVDEAQRLLGLARSIDRWALRLVFDFKS